MPSSLRPEGEGRSSPRPLGEGLGHCPERRTELAEVPVEGVRATLLAARTLRHSKSTSGQPLALP